MFNHLFTFIACSLISASLYAQVYKCEDHSGVRFSSIPCINESIELVDSEQLLSQYTTQEERFITPVYPGWEMGWKKIKDLKLARFSEVVYEPKHLLLSEKYAHINKQKLTNLPQSMTVQRFVASVEDIIESNCVNTVFIKPKITKDGSGKVFYGDYACSSRRDTQQGEIGTFKVTRGENSIYMMTIKWPLPPFEIQQDKKIPIMDDTQQERVNFAKQYLLKQVKLCTAGNCL